MSQELYFLSIIYYNILREAPPRLPHPKAAIGLTIITSVRIER